MNNLPWDVVISHGLANFENVATVVEKLSIEFDERFYFEPEISYRFVSPLLDLFVNAYDSIGVPPNTQGFHWRRHRSTVKEFLVTRAMFSADLDSCCHWLIFADILVVWEGGGERWDQYYREDKSGFKIRVFSKENSLGDQFLQDSLILEPATQARIQQL